MKWEKRGKRVFPETDIKLLKGDNKGAQPKVFSSKFLSYFVFEANTHPGTHIGPLSQTP